MAVYYACSECRQRSEACRAPSKWSKWSKWSKQNKYSSYILIVLVISRIHLHVELTRRVDRGEDLVAPRVSGLLGGLACCMGLIGLILEGLSNRLREGVADQDLHESGGTSQGSRVGSTGSGGVGGGVLTWHA